MCDPSPTQMIAGPARQRLFRLNMYGTGHWLASLAKSIVFKAFRARSNLAVSSGLAKNYKDLYSNVWDTFYNQVLAVPIEKVADKEGIGQKYADARGLILSRQPDQNGLGFFLLPNHGVERSLREPVKPFSDNEDFRCANTLLPFMRAGAEGVEHSFSRLLGGNCIYTTALGAQPPEIKKTEMPITYLMLATHDDPWQMGLLVDRINVLGSARLATLFDLEGIATVGEILHGLEHRLEKLTAELSKTLRETGAEESAKDTTKELLNVWQELAEIGEGRISQKKNSPAANISSDTGVALSIQGGLAYRVERSRFYRALFDDTLGSLHLNAGQRIPGFQPYDEFVNRRLGGTYDYINMVGIRFERLLREINSINQYLTTVRIDQQTSASAEHQDEIKKIQTLAELFGTAILGPTAIFGAIATALGEKRMDKLSPKSKMGLAAISMTCSVAILRGGKSYARHRQVKETFRLAGGEATTRREVLAKIGRFFKNVAKPDPKI